MNSEDWIIDRTIESRREVNAGYSPTINRLRHLTDAEAAAYADGANNEVEMRRAARYECNCYPRGFVSWSRELKAQIKADHIKSGVHEMRCPMWVNPNPMYSRRGDTIPPSYTRLQQRRDEDTDHVDYGRRRE